MDNSSVRVVEGAVDETTALLQQKWDKILYTGLSSFILFCFYLYIDYWNPFSSYMHIF